MSGTGFSLSGLEFLWPIEVKTRQAVLRLAQDKKSVLLGRNYLSCREIRRGGA
jgi:hypothetical protein